MWIYNFIHNNLFKETLTYYSSVLLSLSVLVFFCALLKNLNFNLYYIDIFLALKPQNRFCGFNYIFIY